MTWDDLFAVNADVNKLPYLADPSYLDDWSPIDESGGDCDSYAVGKFRRLVEQGHALESLRLATCYTETNEYHAVLIASADEADWMLDNRFPKPILISDIPNLGYKKDKMQGEGLTWVEWK